MISDFARWSNIEQKMDGKLCNFWLVLTEANLLIGWRDKLVNLIIAAIS